MQNNKKIRIMRIIGKCLVGILAAVACFVLLGTLGADFFGNLEYWQMCIQLSIAACFMVGSVVLQWMLR